MMIFMKFGCPPQISTSIVAKTIIGCKMLKRSSIRTPSLSGAYIARRYFKAVHVKLCNRKLNRSKSTLYPHKYHYNIRLYRRIVRTTFGLCGFAGKIVVFMVISQHIVFVGSTNGNYQSLIANVKIKKSRTLIRRLSFKHRLH